MNIIDEITKQGDFTVYGVPTVQFEGSFIYMHNDIQKIKDIGYWGALAIFKTPGMTMEKLKKICPLRDAQQGEMLNWMRKNFELVEQIGDFWSDKNK